MVKKLEIPFNVENSCPADIAMRLIFSKGGTNAEKMTDEQHFEQYGIYRNDGCGAYVKLPNKVEHYISAKETIEFQETKIDINLREIVEQYIQKYNGQADPLELSKVIWNQAIDVVKVALEDYFKRAGGKSAMVTKYVNNRLDKYYMNKTE